MSTSIQDLKSGESNCCGAPVYTNQMICSDCKEHCDIIKHNCEVCKDTGEIEIMGGSDADEWGVVDIKRCNCQED